MAYTGDPDNTALTDFDAKQLEQALSANKKYKVGRRLKNLRADAADHETRVAALEVAQIETLPADAIGYIGTRTVAQLNALGLTPAAGTVAVAGSAATPTNAGSDALVIGDVAEANDAGAWKKLLSAVGGFVPDGTILVVSTGTLYGPLTDVTDIGKIATFGGASNTATLTVPTDGEVRVMRGELSVNESKQYVYDSSPSKVWTQTSAPLTTVAPLPIAQTAALGVETKGAHGDHVHAHGDQGSYAASLHDADQVDYERTDGLKARIQSTSDTAEAALTDLDDALAAVVVRNWRGQRTIAQIDGGLAGLATGDAVTLTDAGTPAAGASDAGVIGSVMEYDGTQWQEILAGSGGFVAAGARLIAHDSSTLFAPLTDVTDRHKVCAFDGTSLTSATKRLPVDGEARLVKGETALEENQILVYDAGSTAWGAVKTKAANVPFADTDGTFAATDVNAALIEARNTLRTRGSTTQTLSAGGVLTVTRSSHLIDTNAGVASQDLTGITGMETGQLALFGLANAAHNVVFKHAGTVVCPGALDVTLDAADDFALVFYDGAKHHVMAVALAAQPAVGTSTTSTHGGAGNAGKLLALDGSGKADGIDLTAVTAAPHGGGDASKLLKADTFGGTTGVLDAGGGARWFKKTLAFGDFSAAALFKTVDVVDLTGLDFIVEDAWFQLGTEYSGGAVATATLELGTDGDPDGLVVATNVFTGAGAGRKGDLEADKGALQPTAVAVVGSPASVPGGGKLQATLRTTVANTSALTAGSAVVYFKLAVVAGA